MPKSHKTGRYYIPETLDAIGKLNAINNGIHQLPNRHRFKIDFESSVRKSKCKRIQNIVDNVYVINRMEERKMDKTRIEKISC